MRILIVEDEEEIMHFLKDSFESENFVVDGVTDGDKGSFLARTNKYDVVILDNVLPGKNGKQICKEIRAVGSKVPIIILSMVTGVDTKLELFETGANDYITKPFSFRELVARIKVLTRTSDKVEKEIYEIDDLVLDVEKGEVRRGGKKILLTYKEFILLEYLLKNKGKLMSRGTIMEQVWDKDTDPFSNTIETHILNLRRKIGGKKRRKLIHTMSRRGYKIELDE